MPDPYISDRPRHPQADLTTQFRIGNPEKAGLSPPGSPAVLDDKVLPSIIIAHKQNRMTAGQDFRSHNDKHHSGKRKNPDRRPSS